MRDSAAEDAPRRSAPEPSTKARENLYTWDSAPVATLRDLAGGPVEQAEHRSLLLRLGKGALRFGRSRRRIEDATGGRGPFHTRLQFLVRREGFEDAGVLSFAEVEHRLDDEWGAPQLAKLEFSLNDRTWHPAAVALPRLVTLVRDAFHDHETHGEALERTLAAYEPVLRRAVPSPRPTRFRRRHQEGRVKIGPFRVRPLWLFVICLLIALAFGPFTPLPLFR